MNISAPTNLDGGLRIAGDLVPPRVERRERRAVSYCDIWELVASGEPCPACHNSYEDRLQKARGPI